MDHPRVLFVCVQNAGRSQIAEALFEALSDGVGSARSAGSRPAQRIHPQVAAALVARGYDVSGKVPKPLTAEDADWADVVVTMGCGDECPVTGKPTEDWELPDPDAMSERDVGRLIDEVARRVSDLLTRITEPTTTT